MCTFPLASSGQHKSIAAVMGDSGAQVIVDIVHEAFEKQLRSDIEAHFGRLFRTPYFNTAGRKYAVPICA